jgi:hypothetical protein
VRNSKSKVARGSRERLFLEKVLQALPEPQITIEGGMKKVVSFSRRSDGKIEKVKQKDFLSTMIPFR